MSALCAIQGCPASCRSKKRGEKIYFFRPLKDQLEEWNRAVPGDYEITEHDKVCSRHFMDEDLMKEWKFVIDDKTVTMPRARWTLRVGAVPAIFDNYKDDLRVKRYRKSKPVSLVDYAESSSDEEQPKKLLKKSNPPRSPKVVKKAKKTAPEADVKISACSFEDTPGELNQAADIEWENECDSFVDQLSSLCPPAPARKADAKPAKRGVGRPRKARRGRPVKVRRGSPRKAKMKGVSVAETSSSNDQSTKLGHIEYNGLKNADCETENSVIIEEFLASGCDETIDVEILDAPDYSSNSQLPSNVTIKEENCDDGYDRYDSVVNRTDTCSVTTISEDSVLPERHSVHENDQGHGRVIVKRELCDCEGDNSQCCAPGGICGHTVLELPASPVSHDEIDLPLEEPQIHAAGNTEFPEADIEPNERASKITVVAAASCERSLISDSHVETVCQATRESATRTPTPGSRTTELLQAEASEMDLEKIPSSSKNQPHVNEGSEFEMDFHGFPSDEEKELTLKRKHFENTAEMAIKSTKLYFSRLRKLAETSKKSEENVESPSLTELRSLRKRKSNADIASDQLEGLASMVPASSKKPPHHTKKCVEKEPALIIQKPSVQDEIRSDQIKGTLKLAPNYDEVLKSGRISDEVTVTKALKPSQSLDKVTSTSTFSLDKVVSSSNQGLISDKLDLKAHLPKKTPNEVATSSNYPLKDKITPTSNQYRNYGLFQDQGTSSAVNELLKDKIPTTYSGTATDRLSLLSGSSLDRIIQSTRSSSLLDNVTSHTADPTVDKTSLILKNFKSDGVLALECVVLKEQVRQLQKELFIHKQMLIDSEHNASILQRRLELQAQLPCANCVNIRRGFLGKETLI